MSRTLLSILTGPSVPSVTVPKSPITIGVIVTCMFHSLLFFCFIVFVVLVIVVLLFLLLLLPSTSNDRATLFIHYKKNEFLGGARGVMVIVVGNGHSDTSSNPGRD